MRLEFTKGFFFLVCLTFSFCICQLAYSQKTDKSTVSKVEDIEINFRAFTKKDTSLLPLRACVLRTKLSNQKSHRVFSVEIDNYNLEPDTTTAALLYRYVANQDTLKEAYCSLPNSVDVVKAVVKKIKETDSTQYSIRNNVDWQDSTLPPSEINIIECSSNKYYNNCFITENLEKKSTKLSGIWNFSTVPQVIPDSTDYGIPGKSLYMKQNPDCLLCKLPSNVYTVVDELNRRIKKDPFYLIKNYGEKTNVV